MTRRPGHTYRILDGERYTLAFGGNYIADGSHRRPVINIIRDRHQVASVPLPHVRFRRCYRLRRIGGLRWYRLWHRGMRRLCK
jgi:hypothetical protein